MAEKSIHLSVSLSTNIASVTLSQFQSFHTSAISVSIFSTFSNAGKAWDNSFSVAATSFTHPSYSAAELRMEDSKPDGSLSHIPLHPSITIIPPASSSALAIISLSILINELIRSISFTTVCLSSFALSLDLTAFSNSFLKSFSSLFSEARWLLLSFIFFCISIKALILAELFADTICKVSSSSVTSSSSPSPHLTDNSAHMFLTRAPAFLIASSASFFSFSLACISFFRRSTIICMALHSAKVSLSSFSANATISSSGFNLSSHSSSVVNLSITCPHTGHTSPTANLLLRLTVQSRKESSTPS